MEELMQDLRWLADKHKAGDDNQKRVAGMIYSILGALERGGIIDLYNLVHDFTVKDLKRIRGMLEN